MVEGKALLFKQIAARATDAAWAVLAKKQGYGESLSPLTALIAFLQKARTEDLERLKSLEVLSDANLTALVIDLAAIRKTTSAEELGKLHAQLLMVVAAMEYVDATMKRQIEDVSKAHAAALQAIYERY